MGLWPLLTDVLPDLKFTKSIDDVRPDQESDQQCRQTCKYRPKGQIAEDPKEAEVGKQLLIKQPIKQTRLRVISYSISNGFTAAIRLSRIPR